MYLTGEAALFVGIALGMTLLAQAVLVQVDLLRHKRD
jgi:hypothetical protein